MSALGHKRTFRLPNACPLYPSGHSRERSPCLTKNPVQCSDVPREKSLFGWEHRCTAPAPCVHGAGLRFTPDICGAPAHVCFVLIADIRPFLRFG
jgi:hypothetical protein